ncbi:MAG: hypothetical protein ACXABY_25100 [Candidatus Thorarchaeota archaeon]
MELRGFTHIVGSAGVGKTVLATVIAADISRGTKVEWINTDAKTRFIPHLKATIDHLGGREENVAVTVTKGHKQALETVLSLPNTIESGTSLVVVDPITRVIDMARTDPILWGQELIEEALPTLAALTEGGTIDVIVVSEMRLTPEVGIRPVHFNAISKWADNTVKVCLDSSGKSSSIFIEEDDDFRKIAQLQVRENGACHISISDSQGVIMQCLEKEF